MKFKVRNQPDAKDERVEFWLEQSGDTITLLAQKDREKFEWAIVSISPFGLTRYTSVASHLGMPLNDAGQIKDRT